MKYSYHTISHAKLAPARYEWMTRQAERAGIEQHHAPCVTVADLPRVPQQYSERLARIYYRRPLLPTELACTLSHLGLWRKLLASDEDAYVIFEDDVELDPHLDQLVREALATGLPRLVRLSAFYDQPYTVVAELSHERQLNFSRTCSVTNHCRGTTSSVSVTSSPIFDSLVPPQQGHVTGAT